MLQCLSTHLFLRQRLHPGLLDQIAQTTAAAVEIFAARQHFDYLNRVQVAELAAWFHSNPLVPWSMHAPLFPDTEMGRSGAPAVSLLNRDKARRIESMDEIKRALESAEHIPFKNLIVHLGEREDTWNAQALEYAMTALEHLGAFARPLGVKLLAENLVSDATQPEHILSVLQIGHLDNVGICLDTGHAHITCGVEQAIAAFGNRIHSVHFHDNHATRDEHLWPGEGNIDWSTTMMRLRELHEVPAKVLEIHYTYEHTQDELNERVRSSFQLLAGN